MQLIARTEPSQATRAPPRERDRFEKRVDYRFLHALARIYGRAYHQLHQHNRCPIPATGPALVAANHTAGLDPAIIQAACPRPIVWVMTQEFYDLRALQWFFRWTSMIRIDVRGRDPRAWRQAIRHLELGRVVGVFPEGRIEPDRSLMPLRTGVALLAIRGRADIYPIFLDGLQRNTPMLQTYLLPQHPSVAWGAPLRMVERNPTKQSFERVTRQLAERLERLRGQYPAPRRRGRSPLQGRNAPDADVGFNS